MKIPKEMDAITVAKPGKPSAMKLAKRPVPQPGQGEVLIKVAAAGVNRPDVMQRQGKYPPPPGASDILGLEVAGTIVALGPGAQGVRVGDHVCALLSGGGYAEYAVAAAWLCLPVPHHFSLVEAAAVPETFFTVWDNVFTRGRLKRDETLLVHGGSSGIGTTAIQLAHAFQARVLATAGSTQKCEACMSLGADLAIDYKTEDFVAVVKEATQGRGVDVILDMVGGDYFPRNIEALAVEGRLVQIATQAGAKSEINLVPLMQKRITVTGSTLRPRTVAQKAVIAGALRAHVWPLLDSGKIRPLIHAMIPLAHAAEAHTALESGAHIGKIVLAI
jgi:NADPH:quinone reductase